MSILRMGNNNLQKPDRNTVVLWHDVQLHPMLSLPVGNGWLKQAGEAMRRGLRSLSLAGTR
ncbi:hypothetical protein [Spirulina subsalsa]|uniref:hypothetical protein n=1 Tax=Spirulina subsalsa TaxID=54311 RepID=UPI0013DE9F30|nr:hypothetical protein [Spirulina subsalsa]